MTKQFIISQLSNIDFKINNILEQLQSLPKGKLSFYRSGQYIRWVQIANKQKIPIPKKKKLWPTNMNNALHKLRLYVKNGYIPGINLILTSETNQIPLNPLLVNDLVQRFLL